MSPTNGLPRVANGNTSETDPESLLRQIRELAVCVDDITTRTALRSLTSLLEAARSDDGGDPARSAAAAADMAESAKVLESHIRRLLVAAAAI